MSELEPVTIRGDYATTQAQCIGCEVPAPQPPRAPRQDERFGWWLHSVSILPAHASGGHWPIVVWTWERRQ